MEKYKICPLCSLKNRPDLFECTFCETDLASVRVLDEETEKAFTEKQSEPLNTGSKTVRICDCGEKNPPNARKCSSCREDISDISPTTDIGNTIKHRLSSIDGEYVFEIVKPVITVGREQGMKEYLHSKPFVSRIHAKILADNNVLIIENLSNINFTYVNNKKMSLGEQVVLSDGDELGLGGFNKDGERQKDAAYFIVRINS